MKRPTHYTLIMSKPESILSERFPHVQPKQLWNTGQYLVWDGPAAKTDIYRLYDALQPHCTWIFLGRGKGSRGECVRQDGKIE